MSTGEKSAEEILTSNSEVMELCELNVNKTNEELEIVYSHIQDNKENNTEKIKSANSVEISLGMETKSHSLTDRLGEDIPINAYPEVIQTPLLDEKDVEFVEVDKTNVTTFRKEFNDVDKLTGLAESTFGLVTDDSKISKLEPMLENLNSTQSNVITALSTVTQLNEHSDKNLLIGQNKNTAVRVEITKTANSLFSLAADYASSDSDSNDEEMVPSPTEIITIVDDHDYKNQDNSQYRSTSMHNNTISEDSDSDSDESDDSSNDSSDDSNTESGSEIEVEDGSDNIRKAQPSKIKKSKSEYEDLPPIEELKITVAEELCDRLGEVSGIVEQLVIVRPISGKPTLNLDSVLFLEKGHRVLGQVFDVFGQVADPHYCVRFNSEEHVKKSGIVLGMEVYYSPTTEHTSLVFLHELVKLKGVDISGEDDIEPPEFSDDEEERAYNQLQKQKQRRKPGTNDRQDNSESEILPQKRKCRDRQRNPWSSDWQSRNYGSPRASQNSCQGQPRWGPEHSHPPFQNSSNSQPVAYQSNQMLSSHYGQPDSFDAPQYQFNPYNNMYPQNNLFPPQNPSYVFGRPPGFRPNFNNYGSNLYRPGPYQPPPMSWAPPPPPPPPPPSSK